MANTKNVNNEVAVIRADMSVKSRWEIEGGVEGTIALYIVSTEDRIYILEYSCVYEDASDKCRLGEYDVYVLVPYPEERNAVEYLGADLAFNSGYGFYKEPIRYEELPLSVKAEALKSRYQIMYNPEEATFTYGSE